VAFRREVHDRSWLVLAEQVADSVAVADIGAGEDVARIALELSQVCEVARIGQLVDVDQRLGLFGAPLQHEVRADKAGAARDENHFALARSALPMGSSSAAGMIFRSSRSLRTFAAHTSGGSAAVSSTNSGLTGSSYAAEMPV